MEAEVARRRTYAPWINHVLIGGAIWTPPVLKTFVRRVDQQEFHALVFFMLSFRKGSNKRKLGLKVEVLEGPEYWHSVLKEGDPITVAGELHSRRVVVPWSEKPINFFTLACHVITRLWPPPPWSGGRRPMESLTAPELDHWTESDDEKEVDEKV